VLASNAIVSHKFFGVDGAKVASLEKFLLFDGIV
jgi:hypothetical protein